MTNQSGIIMCNPCCGSAGVTPDPTTAVHEVLKNFNNLDDTADVDYVGTATNLTVNFKDGVGEYTNDGGTLTFVSFTPTTPFVDIPDDFTFVERISDTNAHQGVAADDTFYYTTGFEDNYTIRKYNRSDNSLAAQRINCNNDGVVSTQINHMFIHGDQLIIGANNYPATSPKISWVKIYNRHTLDFIEFHVIQPRVSEGGSYKDGFFWMVWNDTEVISKYDQDWNFVADYPLSYPNPDFHGYQGVVWINDYVMIPQHEGNTNKTVDVYQFDGTTFNQVKRIPQPSLDFTAQGISRVPRSNVIVFAERYFPDVPSGSNIYLATLDVL